MSGNINEDDNFSDVNIPDWVVLSGIITVIINFIIFGLAPWFIGIYTMISWLF